MSFGKRTSGRGAQEHPELEPYPLAAPSPLVETPGFNRLIVLSLAAVVLLAALWAVIGSLRQSAANQPIQVEASLVDGSPLSASAHARTIEMCVENNLFAQTRGETSGDEHRPRFAQSCTCAIDGASSQLTPLQMQMLYIDQRTRVRAALARIDRTGERFAVGATPLVEIADGAPAVVMTTHSYEKLWSEARSLFEQQTARCQR